MADLSVSIALSANPRTTPLLRNEVKPDGIELRCSTVHPSELFWRQLKFAEFDISEMSLSTYLIARANGDDRWIALPVFPTRYFFHTWIFARRDRGIEHPRDLVGKRVGVPEYQQTAALWIRGVLEDEFGVRPRDMHFWMERSPEKSHGGATNFRAPEGVTIDQIPADSDIGQMMASGALDATLLYVRDRNLVDRSRIDLDQHPMVKYLFPDPVAEGVRYYRKTGVFPVNHTIVVRRALLEKNPWIAINMFKAFQEASERAEQTRLEYAKYHVDAGLVDQSALRVSLCDYGVAANKGVLEKLLSYSLGQGLTPRRLTLEEMFAESTLGL